MLDIREHMFVIRKQQVQALSAGRMDAFVGRLVRHLRDDFPQYLRAHALPEENLEPMVRTGLKEAEQYGVIYESDVERYIECMAMLGPAFPRDSTFPWAGETLRRHDLDGRAKMDLISDHVAFEVEALPR